MITITLTYATIIWSVVGLFMITYILRIWFIYQTAKEVYRDACEDIDPDYITHQLESIEDIMTTGESIVESGDSFSYRVNMLVGLNSEFAARLAELCTSYQFSYQESVDYSIGLFIIKFVKL